MKKMFAVLLVAALLLMSAGAFAEARKVGIDICSTDIFNQQIEEVMTKRCKELGWETVTTVNYQEGNTNVQNVQNLLTVECDYIMSYSTDAGAQETVRQMCEDAGVPVVFIGLELDGYTTVAGNNYDGGKYVGQKLCESADKIWGGQVDMVLVNEFPEVGEINDKRMGGMVEKVKELHPELTDDQFVYVDGGLDVMKSTEVAAAAFTAHPEAKHILCLCATDIYQGIGCYNSANAAGRLDQVMIGGFHMSDPSTPGIMVQHPETWIGQVDLPGMAFGQTAIDLIEKFDAGEEDIAGKMYFCDFLWLDSTNVADYYPVVF